ncbi:hypothetical protein BC936DRAFT_147686 [Jimgerdemannia flammicorona]|uniref:Uncharacterized protein n=1 Tax=Jimgerdemannia flammicorona TaxID=994334 RepID=A0A433D4Q8_9FUNG|nr:hypothetical protein BC936DRAFT_147686 [Jimgerdemannia flammicorona]
MLITIISYHHINPKRILTQAQSLEKINLGTHCPCCSNSLMALSLLIYSNRWHLNILWKFSEEPRSTEHSPSRSVNLWDDGDQNITNETVFTRQARRDGLRT